MDASEYVWPGNDFTPLGAEVYDDSRNPWYWRAIRRVPLLRRVAPARSHYVWLGDSWSGMADIDGREGEPVNVTWSSGGIYRVDV